MSEKEKDDEIIELTEAELSEILENNDFENESESDAIRTVQFINADPYAKAAPRPADAPRREVSFDEKGNIVVKNPSAFWLPDVKLVEDIGGTDYTVTGSYEGVESLDKKLNRILAQNAADSESDIMEDGE